jgi:esterase/lipase
MEHEVPTAKAIVLIHGLTDSPYFMTAIGDYFFQHLGYNVYLPLLQCHALKKPNGMEGVKLDEWKANVNFAVDMAASKAHQVSIGGLSTGGALSFYTAVNNSKINGTLRRRDFCDGWASDRHFTNGVALKQRRDRRRMGRSHAF